ncbi:MAG: hypothetical protein E6J91_02590 [Deltaproteobacteria bacterium]|nr:MAG: hypothetical protein E6J91_02590 [Deltaproteobacteria bacterium]
MLRSLRFERAATVTRLTALAAPILAWASSAAAAPDAPAAPDPASPDATSVAASPDASAPDATAPDAPGFDGSDAPAEAAPETPPPESPAPEPATPSDAESAPAPADIAGAPETPPPPSVAAAPDAAPALAPEVAAPRASATVVAAAPSRAPWIGAMADLGLPDGATMSLVVRPIRSIRAHAGLSHNLISLGERVGVTWAPLSWWVSPTVSLEYGHYTDGNANPLVRAVSGDTMFSSAVLDRVGYNYANAHLGIELGRRWFTFYIHAGASRITSTIHNLSAETMSESAETTSVTFSKDPSVRLLTVSARIGFVVYLAK